MNDAFLTAEWRKLAMVNYAVNPSILGKYLPAKTELDLWKGTHYISLVGFMFLNTRVKGISIPFHRNFEEVNLRFYVRYKNTNGEWKRGTVFIKEIVPKFMITTVANAFFGEHYQTLPMKHSWETQSDSLQVEYQWNLKGWQSFKVVTNASPSVITDQSKEEFITEHYWGYTKLHSGQTSEYGVEHSRWLVYGVRDYTVNVDFGTYGKEFEFLNQTKPDSVLLAEGSEIIVRNGTRI